MVVQRPPSTPKQPRQPFSHVKTPVRQDVQTLYWRGGYSQLAIRKLYLESPSKPRLSQPTISRIVNDPSARMAGHTPRKPEKRGFNSSYSQEEKEKMIQTTQEQGMEVKRLKWSEVPGAANIDTAGHKYEGHTIRRLFQNEATLIESLYKRSGWIKRQQSYGKSSHERC